VIRKVQTERTKGPFESGAVKQYVWARIKYKAILFKAGSKAPGFGTSLEHENAQSSLCQPDRGS
jgi:hypothetical protein